jgi:hypothetical protein
MSFLNNGIKEQHDSFVAGDAFSGLEFWFPRKQRGPLLDRGEHGAVWSELNIQEIANVRRF